MLLNKEGHHSIQRSGPDSLGNTWLERSLVEKGISTREASRILKVSQRRVIALLKTKELIGQQIEGKWFISPESIEAYQEKKVGQNRNSGL